MARKKMDRLSRESCEALAAGMSYGKWKALQAPMEVTIPEPDGNRSICQHCGKVFYQKGGKRRKYCDDKCSKDAENERSRMRAAPIIKTCAECGKEFQAPSGKYKYCGERCYLETRRKRQKEHRARSAEPA